MYDKLAPDFIALQADLAPLEKSATNPFFHSKYAPLPEVRKAMIPILAKHNFGLSIVPKIIFNEVTGEPKNGLGFILLHKSGQCIEGDWLLTPAKNDSQGQGADVTYKRRFGEMAITGLVADEDDDGNAASFRPVEKPKPEPKRQSAQKAKSEADVKRDQLRALAEGKKWDLAKVAAKFVETVSVNGDSVELKDATAESVERFITALEAGVVTI